MFYYFKSVCLSKRTGTAMLLVITFVAILNCFYATEISDCHNKRYKYVQTRYGTVRGHTVNNDYIAFLGIPYAEPPTGNNRFKAPKPPQPWTIVYDANRTTKCPQKGEGEEDCLVLNIFTPMISPETPIPVLLYIHGGSFIMGAGPTAGVEYLIKQNIIVVTINYRLGALGFLCLGIKDAPGNAGLKDQVAALKFVRNNIAQFGGDPKQVTVYGMSAGGASVEYLMLSSMSRRLFHQAIIESGSATAPWALDRNPSNTAMKISRLMNVPKTDFAKILAEHYKGMPVELLTEMTFEYYNNLTDGTFGFAPCVEKYTGEEHFLTRAPSDILKRGKFRKIPTMFLFSTLEGLYLRSTEYYELNYRERMESNFLEFLPADLITQKDEVRHEIAENIKRFYFGNRSDDIVVQHLNYFGDSLILHSLMTSVEAHSKCNPVYLMEFAYKGKIGGYDYFYENSNVAGHGDVVKYAILNKNPKEEADKITVRRVSSLIGNYVKYGNPTPSVTPLLPIRWPTVSRENVTCLYLDREFQVFSHPYWDRKTFWDDIYNTSKRKKKH
ncbi:esterase FE4-like [Ostrinia nubilalis]|uniref:esterase FE4-like n=1 Tax=Ostrinia nubilalis TaxID=29057 RepID=UPI0030824F34